MARLEDLIGSVQDPQLRSDLSEEIKALKAQMTFGLVFERHIPETVSLAANGGLRIGDQVALRKEAEADPFWITSLNGSKATIVDDDGKSMKVPVAELLVVRRIGDPVFPTLKSLGAIERSKDRPYHCVIKGENYHALQLLVHTFQGRVDCIYIDPPFNTGARDWKYNNHFVDSNDRWRHSKWLSMMQKRLALAQQLLKPNGVLIVAIDEHEIHHLGMLLEQLFPEAYRQVVSIVVNPKGVTQERFSRVEEYALFCFFGNAAVGSIGDDLLTPLAEDEDDDELYGTPRWKGLLRSGTNSRREDRRKMFYPVLVDPKRGAVVDVGEPLLPMTEKPDFGGKVKGLIPAWPVRRDGTLGNWGVGPSSLKKLIDLGYVALGEYDPKRRTWGISYLARTSQQQIASGVLEIVGRDETKNIVDVRFTAPKARHIKTVWHRSTHDAGAYGSDLLRSLIGGRKFPFPKSVHAVRDCLAAVVGNRPDAVILDFFAGSGTTLHSVCLLNAKDGGRRQCLLVTDNEVDAETAQRLHREGHYPGDSEYERHGIFEQVTRPRCEAVVRGLDPDGRGLPKDLAGFAENIEFFGLDYLDPDEVELGRALDALHPLMWLKAGAYGVRPKNLQPKNGFTIVRDAGYAVLFDESAMPELIGALNDMPAVRHLFLCTDSEDAYAEMCELLGRGFTTERLFGDYLHEFRRGTRPVT